MKIPIKVNASATINRGRCKGIIGKVIAYNYEKDEVKILVDSYTNIVTNSDSINQD
jgi:transcription antitermination factor NusG